MKTAFDVCGEYNPSNNRRPPRSAGELQGKSSVLKSEYALVYHNYKQSGHHDTEHEDSIFNRFVQGNSKLLYAFIAWHRKDLSFLGKALDENAAADTGILGRQDKPISSKILRKRKQPTSGVLSNGTTSSKRALNALTHNGQMKIKRIFHYTDTMTRVGRQKVTCAYKGLITNEIEACR